MTNTWRISAIPPAFCRRENTMNMWLTRIASLAVAVSCMGVTSVWAQGKPPMMEQKKLMPQQQVLMSAPPALTRVVPTSYGYDLLGTGFGADKSKLQVFEGSTQLTASAVLSVTSDKIAVQSKPTGSVQHKVVIAGQASGLSFTHAASQAGGQAARQSDTKQNAAMGQPVGGAKDASSAAISTANLKQNIDMKGLADTGKGGSPGGSGGSGQNQGGLGANSGVQQGGRGLQGGRETLIGGSGEIKSSQAKLKEEIGGKGPVTGSNADTFGGQRVNNRNQGGTGNFAGDGKGKTSSGGLDDKAMGGAKGSPEETRYEQQAGSDHYAKTENMNKGEREAYWKNEVTTQKEGSDPPPKEGAAGRPRDDTMGTGSGPMTRQEINFQKRAMDAKSGATGKDDGRTDQQATGGSDGRMIQRDKAGGAERESGIGTVNVNKALEINTRVNPGRQ